MDAADPALRSWALRCAAPLLIFAANAAGFAFTPERVAKGALAVAYTTALSAALVFWRIALADERRRTVRLPPAAPGGAIETLTVREYDTKALKELCSSVAVGLATAWLLHAASVTTNLLVLQTVLLPLTVADHELVRLHVRGASESEPGLRRPWRSEPEKLQAALEEMRRVFASSKRE